MRRSRSAAAVAGASAVAGTAAAAGFAAGAADGATTGAVAQPAANNERMSVIAEEAGRE
jgi:hypothetical protein